MKKIMEAKKLSEMSKDELINEINNLKIVVKQKEENATLWWNKCTKLESKIDGFRDLVKGIMVLVDQPKM